MQIKYHPQVGRELAYAVATAVVGVWIALGPAQSSVAVSRALVAAFLLLAPTLAIARLLPSASVPVAFVVAAAGATAINTLVAQSMLSADLWSRPAGVIAVGLIATLLWLIPAPRRSKPSGPAAGSHS